jgi:hypothetical protein
MAAVAKPEAGATKILLVFARLAKPSCDWIDGSLRIELEAVESKTRFTIMEDLGGGMRELVFPRLVVDAPLPEFDRSLRLAARAVAPLTISHESGKIMLTNRRTRASHEPPPSFQLAEDCLRQSLPPAVRESAAPKSPEPPPRPPPKAKSKRPSNVPRGAELPVLEIPRVAKVLDLGDFADKPAAKPKRPGSAPTTPIGAPPALKKRSSRRPPRA